MKITVSIKEVSALKTVIETVADSKGENAKVIIDTFKKDFFDAGVISFCPSLTGFTIDIKEECILDVMDVYDRFIGLMVQQAMILVGTCVEYRAEINAVIEKYSKKEDK